MQDVCRLSAVRNWFRFATGGLMLMTAALLPMSPALAQGEGDAAGTALEVLSIPPKTALRCRPIPPGALPPIYVGLHNLRFELGETGRDERVIEVHYDSSGRAVVFTDWSVRVSAGRLDQVMAGVTPDGAVEGYYLAESIARMSDTSPSDPINRAEPARRTLPPLSVDAQHRARQLTAWLWANRCGASRTLHGR